MPKYIGLQKQIAKNNRSSLLMLASFPLIVLALIYAACAFFAWVETVDTPETAEWAYKAFFYFKYIGPPAFLIVLAWFLVAYFFNAHMISTMAGARPLERKENKRVYNLIENLCIQTGMSMPQVQIIDDDGLNAFASGINERTYTVTLTRGIVEALDDEELEGVIAHELSHIRNRDVRLMIVSIVFVGIFLTLAELFGYIIRFSSLRSRKKGKGEGEAVVLAVIFTCAVMMLLCYAAYALTFFLKFAISRKREYLADAGGAEITHKPWALASALRKISGHSHVSTVKDAAVNQLFIENEDKPGLFSLFTATHPPIEKRIAFLEQL